MDFSYQNVETKVVNGDKVVRKVWVENGEGYKSITKYKNGKKISTVKRPIHSNHIQKIKGGTFVKGLFKDCRKKNCTHKKRVHFE